MFSPNSNNHTDDEEEYDTFNKNRQAPIRRFSDPNKPVLIPNLSEYQHELDRLLPKYQFPTLKRIDESHSTLSPISNNHRIIKNNSIPDTSNRIIIRQPLTNTYHEGNDPQIAINNASLQSKHSIQNNTKIPEILAATTDNLSSKNIEKKDNTNKPISNLPIIPAFKKPIKESCEAQNIVCTMLAGTQHSLSDVKNEFSQANPTVKIGSILGLLSNGKDLTELLSNQKVSTKIQDRINKTNNNPTDEKLLIAAKKLRDLSTFSDF